MKVIRSWPEKVPDGRPHVMDTLPRYIMRDYDYRWLHDLGDDIVLLEWDIAVGKEDLERFIGYARQNPDRVIVAPYKLYSGTEVNILLPQEYWAHRRYYGDLRHVCQWVTEGEPTCHLFGLGMAYLPLTLLADFADDVGGHFSDGSFSAWHNAYVQAETPITWDVRPVHLHYPIEQIGAS